MKYPNLYLIKNNSEKITNNQFLKFRENFELSQEHLDLLEKSSKTPIEDCKPARQVMDEIREKYIK